MPDRVTRITWGAALVLVGSTACAELGERFGVPVFQPRTPEQVFILILLALLVSAAFILFVRAK